MFRIPLLILAATSLLLPKVTAAETCTCSSETFAWTDLATTSPPGGWDGCTPTTDDLFELGSGCTVEVRAGDRVDLGIGLGSVTVMAGARLEIQAAGELVLPDGDLSVADDGVLALQGRALGSGVSPAFDQTDLGPATYVELGEYIPCPGDDDAGGRPFEDCAGAAPHPGSPSSGALCWPDERFSQSAWVAAIQPADVIVFWDYTGGWSPSRDVNAHYEVVDTRYATSSHRCLVINVEQGSEELVWTTGPGRGYPFSYRHITPVTMRGAQPARDRLLEVEETTINDSDVGGRTPDFNARWLSCAADAGFCFDSPSQACNQDADCASSCVGALIHHAKVTETIDDPNGDVITVLPGGLERDLADGARCFLDYGWHTGDTLAAYRPARLSAPAQRDGVMAESESALATIDFDFAIVDELEHASFHGASIDLDFVWMSDSQGGNSALILAGVSSVRGFQVTGGEADCGGLSCYHSIIFDPQTPNGMDGTVVEDCNLRHSGDDYFVFAGMQPSSDIEVRRCRLAYSDGRGGSNNLIDQAGGSRNFLLDGFLAEDAGTDGNAAPFESLGPGRLVVRNGAMISQIGAPLCSNGTDSPWTLRNIYDVGHVIAFSGLSFLRAAEGGIRDTTFRDTIFKDSSGSRFVNNSIGKLDLDRLLVVDARLQTFSAFEGAADLVYDAHWTDIAIVNAQTTNTTFPNRAVVYTDGNAGETEDMTMERWTVVYPPGATTNYLEGIHLSGNNTTYDTLRHFNGFLIAGLYGIGGTTGGVGGAGGDYDALSALCLYDNEVDAEEPAALPADTILGVDLAFEDEAIGDYRLASSSPGFGMCGARNVGVRADNWALRVLHYDPAPHGDAWHSPGWPGGGAWCGDLEPDDVIGADDLAAYRETLANPAPFDLPDSIRCDLIHESRAPGQEPDLDELAGGCSIADAAVLARRIASASTPPPNACAAVSQHPCCAAHSGVGCGYSETVECVCALDARCCTEVWSEACATLACSGACQDSCGDLTLGPTEECEQTADCDGAETCALDCTCEL